MKKEKEEEILSLIDAYKRTVDSEFYLLKERLEAVFEDRIGRHDLIKIAERKGYILKQVVELPWEEGESRIRTLRLKGGCNDFEYNKETDTLIFYGMVPIYKKGQWAIIKNNGTLEKMV